MLGEVLPAVLEFSDGTEDALLAAVTSQGQDPATLATFPLAPAYILYMATRCVETSISTTANLRCQRVFAKFHIEDPY